jgi:hypothetical protein
MDNVHICCPKCNWEPDGHAYWMCSCKHVWDTFSTGGRCPKCGKVWEDTQCVSTAGGCGKWSPHLDWYQGLDGVIIKLKEEILETWNVPVIQDALV